MPPLGKDEEYDRYKAILEESGRFFGYFEWKRVAAEWVRSNLAQHNTPRAVERLIYEHRSEVRQREETRPEYCRIYQFYYSFIILVDGMEVFIETVFEPGRTSDRDMIRIVSVHPATQ